MRKLVVTTTFTAVFAASLVAPALAAFDPHFEVVSKAKNAHETSDGLAFYEKLIDPAKPANKVGFDRGICKPTGPRTAFCRVVYHLGGEIGGHGTIRAGGVVGAGDNRLNVNGGSGAFDGAAGKVLLTRSDLGRGYGVQHFDLVR